MKFELKDKLKSFVLLSLILLSFVQVGILWQYQNHGLPINFISAFFGRGSYDSPPDKEKICAELFRPYNIIVSEGFDGKRWIVDTNNDDYNRLWKEAEVYLKKIIRSKPVETYPIEAQPSDTSNKPDWYDIVSKKGFIFEFKVNIKPDVLAWLLNDTSPAEGTIGGVYKLALIPRDVADSAVYDMTAYVLDDQKVYKYSFPYDVSGKNKRMTQNEWLKIIDKYSANADLKEYRVSSELHKGTNIRQDLLLNVLTSGYLDLAGVICSPPEGFSLKNPTNTSERNRLAEMILGSERYPYVSDVASDGAVLFTSPGNVYKVYEDGFIDYKYKPAVRETAGKGSMRDAFERAVEFIYGQERRQLVSGADIYISDIREEKESYRFSFDYRITSNNLPVVVSYINKQDKLMKNAITIEATGSRVLSSQWLVRSFEPSAKARYKNNAFNDIIDEISAENLFFKNNFRNPDSGFMVTDIGPAYILTSDMDATQINNPVWVVKTNSPLSNYEYFTVKMKK